MKTFSCTCGNTVYFENSQCLACGRVLGFLPASRTISALEPVGEDRWRALADGQLYRQCQNYSNYNVCNWMVPAEEASGFCISCRLNHVIPDLSQPQNLLLWYRVEVARRRLLYGLLNLGLGFSEDKAGRHGAMGFEFLADSDHDVEFADTAGYQQVLTGYQVYRRGVRLRVRRPEVLCFLLQEKRFPRAFYHAVCEVESCLVTLPHNDRPLKQLAPLQRKVLRDKPEKLKQEQLHVFIDQLQRGLANVHNEIASTYF